MSYNVYFHGSKNNILFSTECFLLFLNFESFFFFQQALAVRDLVESSKCENVKILRRNLLSENVLQDAKPHELVPGDLVVFPKSDFVLPCDIVLLTGQCIVNESMLTGKEIIKFIILITSFIIYTGESVPVTKTALSSSNQLYNPTTHKRNTLFSGTHMIQSRYYGGEPVLGRVVSTGFDTAKGALIKSILYPTPVGIQLYKDSLKFVFALFLIAASGTGYCLYLYLHRKVSKHIFFTFNQNLFAKVRRKIFFVLKI